jgi:ribosomal protein S12 methylthiotransferase
MRFVEARRFERMGAFAYSEEEGTAAADLDAQVGERTRKRRLERLMALQQLIAFEHAASRVGSAARVLVDGPPNDEGLSPARSQAEAPDIDPVIWVAGETPGPGAMLDVRITEARGYDLLARPR